MIVDTFMFFNELDTLEVRLRELNEVVDRFVLVECGEALSGIKKPFIFEDNRDRFKSYLEKIIHIKLKGLPPIANDTETRRFWLESFQRNFIMTGLVGMGMSLDDLVLISDVDEIPSVDAIRSADNAITNYEVVGVFKQKYFKHFFDFALTDDLRREWLGTVAVRYGRFSFILPDDIRIKDAHAGRFYDPATHPKENRLFFENGGWHLTYFGGESAFRYKIANFSHGARDSGAAQHVPVAVISKESVTGLKPYEEELATYLHDVVYVQLHDSLPSIVKHNIQDYYHMFLASYYESPLPWLRRRNSNSQ